MLSELCAVATVAAEPGLLHVILVHHGQSQNDENTRHMNANQTDPALSALGQQQASLLGARLGAQLKEAAASGRLQITCSTMQRALQTAYPLSLALRQSVLVNPELVEQFGFFTSQPSSGGTAGAGKEARFAVPGPLRKHVSQRYPTYDASLVAEEPVALDEDDSQAELRARRIASALQVEALNSPDGTERILVIISHADFLAKLACALLGVALNTAPVEYGDGSECGGAVAGSGAVAGGMQSSSLALNHCATCHLVLRRAGTGGGSGGGPKGSGKGSGKGCGKMAEAPPLMARLLHWNRSDHLAEVSCARVLIAIGLPYLTAIGLLPDRPHPSPPLSSGAALRNHMGGCERERGFMGAAWRGWHRLPPVV